jgi:translocation and assembly module TamA
MFLPPRLAALAVLSAACALPAAAQETRVDYEVQIEAPRAIRTLLEEHLDLLRWRGNPQIDANQLRRLYRAAPAQIRSLVATQGYYNPAIAPRLVPPPGWNAEAPEASAGRGPWRVEFTVDPGEPARIAKVELAFRGFGLPQAGEGDAADNAATGALRAAWAMPAGRVFRHADWEDAKRALLGLAMQKRYPRATLRDSTATVDAETGQVTLHVVLDSGPEVRFGALRVEGNERYPASVIANLNTIAPGEPYDQARLLALQTRLQETGYFNGIEISTEVDEDAAVAALTGDYRTVTAPLVVRVSETLRKKVTLGVGFSTNTGYRALTSYDDLALFGLRLRSNVTLESKRQTARADLLLPVKPGGYTDSIGVAYEHNDIEGEVRRVASLAAKRSWGSPLTERSVTLEYLTEQREVAGTLPARSNSLPLTYNVTFRRVDDLVFPTRGYVLNAQFGGAPWPILTDTAFLRGYTHGALYRRAGEKGNVILRFETGALASSTKTGVPSTFLFRAGGDQSVRGYGYQELGVHEGDATVGGRYLLTGSAEYQYWFLPRWGAAVFVDAGNAADSLPALKPKAGYGVGARWRSPIGPLNVDVAYGQATRKFQLHFSLGLTF